MLLNKIQTWFLGVLALMISMVSVSHAAVDAAVTTALSTALTDVGTVGSAVFIAIIAAYAFKILRRAL